MSLKLPTFLRNTCWQVLAYLTPTLASIVLAPYVLNRIGLARYGEYSLVLIGVGLFANLDAGNTHTVQRWVLNYSAQGDRAALTRVLITGGLCVTSFGSLLADSAYYGHSLILQVVNIPAELMQETILVLPMIGLLLALSLLNSLPQAVLAGEGRFRTITGLSTLRRAVQFAGTIFALEHDAGVRGLLWVTALSFFVSFGIGLALILPSITLSRRLILAPTELRAFMRFASRIQIISVAVLINVQLDALGVAQSRRFGTWACIPSRPTSRWQCGPCRSRQWARFT